MDLRRFGVEEELLLTDATTGALRPVAGPIIAACATPGVTDHRGDGTTRVKHELFLSQVEVAIGPHVSIGDLREELAAARASLAEAGAELGVDSRRGAGPGAGHGRGAVRRPVAGRALCAARTPLRARWPASP